MNLKKYAINLLLTIVMLAVGVGLPTLWVTAHVLNWVDCDGDDIESLLEAYSDWWHTIKGIW